MAGNKKNFQLDYMDLGEDSERKVKKSRKSGNKIILIVSSCVLVAALAVFVILFTGNKETVERIVDFGTAIQGVKVGSVDISKMTRDQALAATASLEKDKLATVKFTLDVNGQTYNYGASDFGVASDYTDVIDKAMEYGHTGTFEEREKTAAKALSEGVSFDITLSVNDDTLKTSFAGIKASLDKTAKDATATFMPWGYTLNADGTATAFTPDLKTIQAIVEAESGGKEYTNYPALATTADADMPSTMRYEYYQNSKFIAGYDRTTSKFLTGYRPTNAKISRFYYTPEVEGLSVDMDSIADQIKSEIQSGKYDTIKVPCQSTEPTVKLADLKKNTQLVTSWTSSFSKSSHYKPPRNWNVAMISALINNGGPAPTGQAGSIINPGQKWSVNDTVGLRTASTSKTIGWKKAAGIENGGYTAQYGGGVCQLGSTTYNAAIRAQSDNGLKVIDFTHHTIPSDYEPAGLDATLSTPAPDLKLENDGTTPYYVVSYVNPTEKTVTVEIYGPSLTDSTGKDIIHTFTSKFTGSYGAAPVSRVVECPGPEDFVAPDQTIVNAANPTYQYAQDMQGRTAEIWIISYALDGTQLTQPTVYDPKVVYSTINGTIYQWTGPGLSPSPTDTTTTTTSS